MTSAYDTLILGESGLQAYYPLDESSGTTAHDLSSNAYHGTITGGVTLGQTSLLLNDAETAMLFDGSTGYIALPSGLNPVGWSAITLEGWLDASALSGFIIGNTSGGGSGAELLAGSPGNYLSGNCGTTSGDGGAYAACSFTPQTGVTYHVAFVWDGAHMTMLLNGTPLGTQVALGGTIASSGHVFNIGRDPNGGSFFHGVIQKVAVYNVALTAAKLQAHAVAGAKTVSGSYSSVVLADSPSRYYRLNDALGSSTLADSSTNNIAATVNNTTHFTLGNAGVTAGADTSAHSDGNALGDAYTTSTTGLPTAGGSGAATLEIWLDPGATGTQVPFEIGNGSVNQSLFLALTSSFWGSDGVAHETPRIPYLAGYWYYAAVTYSAGVISLFLNGVLVGTLSDTITWTYATDSLYIGNFPGALPYTGYSSQAAVYTSALSAATIRQHYLAGVNVNTIVFGSPSAIANSAIGIQPSVGPASVKAVANATFSATGSIVTPTGAPTFSLLLGGVRVNLIAGSLDLTNQIGQRSQGRASVWSGPGVSYDYGTSVSVVDNLGNTVYTGFVLEDQITLAGIAPKLLQHDLTIADNHYLADKRLASLSALNSITGIIVKRLWQTYLAAEGVTIGAIADGIWIPEFVVNYETVSSQLDKLAAMSGYWWQIDQNRQLFFQPYGAQPGPYVIDGATIDQTQQFTVTVGNKDYRNRQYGVGGRNHTSVQTENFVGDSLRRTWTLRYPVASLSGHDPKSGLTKGIYLNGVLQTNVSPKSEGTNTEWGYAVSDAVIAQWSSYPVLTSGDNLQIIYEGEYPIVALAQNKAEIANQRAKEGIGTGYVEARYGNLKVHTLEAMFTEAQAQLGYYSQTMTTLVFTTRTPGLAQGQTLTVNLPDFTLNNRAMLVESVEITDSIDAQNIWYVVTCVGSPYSVAQWQTFWQQLLNQDHTADLDADNQTLDQSLAEVSQSQAAWNWTAIHTTPTVTSCPICGPSTLCGPALLVC